jgi:hypothetical protein
MLLILSDISTVAHNMRSVKDGNGGTRGASGEHRKRLVRRLMKGSRKQPWLIVFIIVFLSMKKKKVEPEKDENYWRVLGGL